MVGDASSTLVGQEVLSGGSRAVVDILKTLGSLVKVQRIKHRYPYDWKTDKPIIVTYVFSLILTSNIDLYISAPHPNGSPILRILRRMH